MNLSARINRLEREQPTDGRIVQIWADDEGDAGRKVADMRESGRLRPQDIAVIAVAAASASHGRGEAFTQGTRT